MTYNWMEANTTANQIHVKIPGNKEFLTWPMIGGQQAAIS